MKKQLFLLPLLLTLLLICLFTIKIDAQESIKDQKQNFWQRVSLGGYLGLQFGNVTAITVSPEATVRVVDQLHIGLGFTYTYMQWNNYFYDTVSKDYINYKASVYGGRIFARYYLRSLFKDSFLGNIFAHVEYEYLYYTWPYTQDPRGSIYDPYGHAYRHGTEVQEINSLFVGAGYSQPLGSKAFIDFLVLFNLNETYNSPYSNPIFRIGFGVGL
ncbi:MAG: hypothetical protein NTU98_00930 [Bacteroidetes bacterium]|nr:hypothetical protein [Bacteroidota bacterium]